MFRSSSRWSWWIDGAVVFALAAVLVLPVFRLEYLDNWKSIEGAFVADGRALAENWPHHLWQPLWYCGTRADYVYPPGPRYGVAIFSTLLRVSAVRGYHFFIGFCYAFGFLVLYLWTRMATGSRGAAWFATVSIAVGSPSFLVLPDIWNDSMFHVPQRLHALMTYGEGPHISSLAMLPIAWLGAWKRFHGGSARWLCLSAIGIALTVTINFYGLTAISITMPLLVWACLLERPDWRVVRDAALIGALGWGLTAWWLVPSYIKVTSRNLYLVSPPGNSWSLPALIVLLVIYLAVSLLVRRLSGFSGYTFFIWSGLWWLAVYILGFRWFGFQVAGNPIRLVPEMDVFAILCFVQLAGILWRWKPAARVALVVLLFFAYRPSRRYLKHAYHEFPKEPNWSERVEYKTETWLYEHFPNERTFVTGTIRFWFDAWHDEQEADGAAQQGILNPVLPGAQWLVMHGTDPMVIKWWLQALGVDILVVPGKDSQEPYKDIEDPKKYDAVLPLLRDDGEGNRYYRVPRGSTGIVRVVDRARLEAVPAIRVEGLTTQVQAYAEAVESGPAGDRARCKWRGSDALDVTADVAPGEALLVQETYDPNWHAYEGGRPQVVQADAVGHMLIALSPGTHSIRMVFEAPAEVIAGRIAGIVSLLVIAFVTMRPR
ncbi:MAG TPA: hypothetical protein VK752_19920 [Bryobacteraceae bacterium]|jgi:hypothetical protein|nr:hypothetical protein [Bryobacteraceae bacterium]